MKSTIGIFMACIIVALLLGYGMGIEDKVPARIAPPAVIHTQNGDFNVSYAALPCDLSGCYVGMTYQAQHGITILPGQALKDEQEDVIHEAFHAETGELFPDKKLDGHEAIYDLAVTTQRLLANNPELVRYLEQK